MLFYLLFATNLSPVLPTRDLVYDSFISGNVSSVYTDGVYRSDVRGELFENRRSAMSKTCRRYCSLFLNRRNILSSLVLRCLYS